MTLNSNFSQGVYDKRGSIKKMREIIKKIFLVVTFKC